MTPPRMRHNLLAFGIDFISFSIGISFISPTTVLPAFATRLGASDALIGLLVTVFYLSWDLPQLFAANVVARRPDKKRVLITAASIGRPAILLFAGFLFLTGGEPAWLSMVMLFIALAVLFSTDAFAAIAWFDLLGRAFPPEKRGGYLALWQVIKGVAVLGVYFLVNAILGPKGPSFPYNYALLMLAGSVGLFFSWLGILNIYEVPVAEKEPETLHIAWVDFRQHLVAIWKSDERMRISSIARVLIVLGTMASAFYVLYATEVINLPEQIIGTFILAQTVGALIGSVLLGRITDRQGPLRVIQLGAIIVVAAPAIALGLTLSNVPQGWISPLLLIIYGLLGIAESIGILGFMNYVLDIAPPGQRTIYMGISNAMVGLGVVGPVLAGWILTNSSYSILFGITILFGVASFLLTLRLPSSRTFAVSPTGSEVEEVMRADD